MGTYQRTVTVNRCERCGHEWQPRRQDVQSRVCPACKSPYWDRARKVATPDAPLPVTPCQSHPVADIPLVKQQQPVTTTKPAVKRAPARVLTRAEQIEQRYGGGAMSVKIDVPQ